MLELKETNHNYYCCESNYYVDGTKNWGLSEYEDWYNFKVDWLLSDNSLDDDYNHCFRFDIKEKLDENENQTGIFQLWLFFILQRKGIYKPVWIKKITQEDMVEINEFLKQRYNYLKSQWKEFENSGCE